MESDDNFLTNKGMNEELIELLNNINKSSIILKERIELIEQLDDLPTTKGLLTENLVKKFVNVKVKMYKEVHNKPHIHLDIGKETHNASICINSLEILAGSVKKKYLKTVNNWITENKDTLLKIWFNLQENGELDLSQLN